MRGLVLIAALALAACGQKSANQADVSAKGAATENANAAATESANAASNAQLNQSLGALPPANSPLRFVGLWATSQANCASKPWRFSETKVTATDGPNCSIYKVTKAPGGYDLAASCPGKKPVETDLIRLRFAESARAMLVESNVINPTGLVYCGKES